MGRAQEASRPVSARPGSGVVSRARCQVWGILNVTPDSFSDGGRFFSHERAVEAGLSMWRAGASVVDVGGASSRPAGSAYGGGADPVDVHEELRRVLPVVERLVEAGVRVSVDTSRGEVARQVLAAGASILNDVRCGEDPALIDAVAAAGAELVLMHNRGRGECHGAQARYEDVVGQALGEVLDSVQRARERGVLEARVWIDPGLGFAKTPADCARLLARLGPWVESGQRVLVGASRKRFLQDASGVSNAPAARLPASLVAAVAAAAQGAHAVRVHDVAETLQALHTSAVLAREAAG